MNLITIQNNTPLVSSLIIAENTGNDHRSVYRLITNYTSDFSEFGMVRFEIAGQKTISMLNEDQAALLITFLKNTEKVRAFKVALIKEFKAIKQQAVPQTYAAALLEAGRLAQALEETSAKLIEAKPKVEFYDQVTSSKDAVDMASAAKVLNMGIGRNKLFEILRDEKLLQVNNQPYQKYIDNGCFRVIESKFTKPNGDTSINLKTVVYQKGLTHISKLVNKNSNKVKSVN